MATRWTPKLARARTLRRIKAFENALAKFAQETAYEWSDENQYIVNMCDDISQQFEEPLNDLREAMDQHVEERPED